MKKFICENCKEKFSFTNKEIASRFRIRCPHCGSPRLELAINQQNSNCDSRLTQKESCFELGWLVNGHHRGNI